MSAQTQIDLDDARLLAFKLVAAGQYDTAAELSRTILQSDPRDQAALLALAQAESGAGRNGAAIKAAKAAWRVSDTEAEKYSSAIVAAQAFSTDGKQQRAQFWLRRAAQNAPNDTFKARAKRDFKYVKSVNPLQVNLRFSITPSSNINNGSKSETVEVAGLTIALRGDARALSGIEYNVGASLSYQLPKVGAWNLTAFTSVDAKYFSLSSGAKSLAPTVSGSDYAFQEIEAGLRTFRADEDGEAATWASIKVGANWYGGNALSNYLGVGIGRRIKAGARSSLSFSADAERQWRQDYDIRSANVLSLSVTWAHDLSKGGVLWARAHVSDTASDSIVVAHDAIGATVGYAHDKPIFGDTKLELSLGYQVKSFDRAAAPFARRVDDTVSASATMIFNNLDYMGFAPTAEISAKRTTSTLNQFSLDDLGVKIGLRSTF
ncbi:surface lipoprotein assembly modifier [Litoreibacter meonggei]|uniref:surface lipoprotein assembly modifier n=1 Tax=Litoreibacter meonggei TaxID=1049199 RepID=UPI0014731C02|nr:surface lipoprotein assembly modifier [Litoreibacter meonggei]